MYLDPILGITDVGREYSGPDTSLSQGTIQTLIHTYREFGIARPLLFCAFQKCKNLT